VGSLILSVAATLSGSIAAQAASETLTYISAPFTSVWGASNSSVGDVSVGSNFTATVTLSAPLGDNFNGNVSSDVTSLVFTTVDSGKTDIISVTPGEGAGSSFYFTTNSWGQITGWDFTAGVVSPSAPSSDILFHSCSNDHCASGNYHAQNYGVTGDWYDYRPGSSTAADGCTYKTPTSCGTHGSGGVGKWTVAPELSASNAATGLTLLFGGLAILIGRRRGASATAG